MGFGFGTDDEHINGIIRTLLDVDDKKIVIVTLDTSTDDVKDYARKLKTLKSDNIQIIRVDKEGKVSGTDKTWIDTICSPQIFQLKNVE